MELVGFWASSKHLAGFQCCLAQSSEGRRHGRATNEFCLPGSRFVSENPAVYSCIAVWLWAATVKHVTQRNPGDSKLPRCMSTWFAVEVSITIRCRKDRRMIQGVPTKKMQKRSLFFLVVLPCVRVCAMADFDPTDYDGQNADDPLNEAEDELGKGPQVSRNMGWRGKRKSGCKKNGTRKHSLFNTFRVFPWACSDRLSDNNALHCLYLRNCSHVRIVCLGERTDIINSIGVDAADLLLTAVAPPALDSCRLLRSSRWLSGCCPAERRGALCHWLFNAQRFEAIEGWWAVPCGRYLANPPTSDVLLALSLFFSFQSLLQQMIQEVCFIMFLSFRTSMNFCLWQRQSWLKSQVVAAGAVKMVLEPPQKRPRRSLGHRSSDGDLASSQGGRCLEMSCWSVQTGWNMLKYVFKRCPWDKKLETIQKHIYTGFATTLVLPCSHFFTSCKPEGSSTRDDHFLNRFIQALRTKGVNTSGCDVAACHYIASWDHEPPGAPPELEKIELLAGF